jgi:hypothetical protein
MAWLRAVALEKEGLIDLRYLLMTESVGLTDGFEMKSKKEPLCFSHEQIVMLFTEMEKIERERFAESGMGEAGEMKILFHYVK